MDYEICSLNSQLVIVESYMRVIKISIVHFQDNYLMIYFHVCFLGIAYNFYNFTEKSSEIDS